MSTNKERKRTLLGFITKIVLYFFVFFFLLSIGFVIIELFQGSIEIRDFRILADSYLRLILTSWPAVVLCISLVALIRHYEAIDYFIKKRMTEVGPGGVKGVRVDDATDSEMKQKTIKNTKEDDKIIEDVSFKNKEVELETGVTRRSVPHTTKEDVIKRYKKISQIEEAVQTKLIDTYNDKYKPQVKLSRGDKKVIVDGILFSKKDKIKTAIEIRYISSKRYEALKFIISRKSRQLAQFDIKHLTIILVGDDISPQEAEQIQAENLHQASMYFYNWNNDALIEIELTSRDTHIF